MNDPGERFIDKIELDENNCWIWKASTYPNGYPQFRLRYTMVLAHRFAYKFFIGEIPEDKELDHACKVRLCVNPYHRDVVSHKENVRRSMSPPGINARKTHCIHGHIFSEENTYSYDGKRLCRICRTKRRKEYCEQFPERC